MRRPANARKLSALGCESAADVRDPSTTRAVRKAMTVVGERLVHELRGVPCLDLEEMAPTRKGCAVTRSFSDRVEDLATMEQSVAAHADRLGEKLRREGLGTDPRDGLLPHVGARPGPAAAFGFDGGDTAGGVERYHGPREGLPTRRASGLAGRLPLLESGVVTTDLVPLAASQRAMPGLGQLDREHGAQHSWLRWTPATPFRPRFRRAGGSGLRPSTGLVDEVRDALSPLHDPDRRTSDSGGSLVA